MASQEFFWLCSSFRCPGWPLGTQTKCLFTLFDCGFFNSSARRRLLTFAIHNYFRSSAERNCSKKHISPAMDLFPRWAITCAHVNLLTGRFDLSVTAGKALLIETAIASSLRVFRDHCDSKEKRTAGSHFFVTSRDLLFQPARPNQSPSGLCHPHRV
jgi:hypothetical protein